MRDPREPTFQPRTWWLSSLVAAVTLSLCCGLTLRAADIAPALRWVPAGPAAAAAQPALIRPSQPARPAPHDDIVSRATLLASEGRWHEIVRLYEPEVRAGGLTPEVRRHYDIASIHCDIERRYGERNFRGKLQKMPEQEAFRLYSELLGRIGSHHVDEPDFRQLVERGCLAMETALDDPGFLGFVGVAPSAERIRFCCRQTSDILARRPIATRRDAEMMVNWIAKATERTLSIPAAVTIMEFAAAAMGGLDQYSAFLTSGQLDDLYSQIDGNFVGLGVELKPAPDGLLIVDVISGSPAERAGLRAGDHLVGVGGRSIGGMGVNEAASLLQGPEGSVVTLAILRAPAPARAVTVRREHVEVPSVEDVRILDPIAGVAGLRISSFQKTTATDLEAALRRLEAAGMRSLIVDLRGNPGGLLSAGVDAADLFLDRGLVVATRGRCPDEDFNYLANPAGTWRMPLVVVIDGDSASASEIFAGAIRDHRRGTIVGTRSYGKGSVQGIFPLDIGGMGMRLTTAKFFSPQGRSYNNVGVEPDVLVQTTFKPAAGRAVELANDPFLTTAIETARTLSAANRGGLPQATAAR
jgi:carboxyl-terminal processing protease